MEKISKILMTLFLSVFAVGCFSSNVDTRPQDVYVREFKGLRIEIARTDMSGVFLDVESRIENPISIVWEKSTLGGSEIVRHDGIINTALNHEETQFKPKERKSFVIHRKVDFYYLDPVLYAKGGLRIKPLKYPVELKLVIKVLGREETVSIFVDNNYTSMEDANAARYKEDVYAIEKKENAKILNKDYAEKSIDGRIKADTLPKNEDSFKQNPPIKDTLIIEHRK